MSENNRCWTESVERGFTEINLLKNDFSELFQVGKLNCKVLLNDRCCEITDDGLDYLKKRLTKTRLFRKGFSEFCRVSRLILE